MFLSALLSLRSPIKGELSSDDYCLVYTVCAHLSKMQVVYLKNIACYQIVKPSILFWIKVTTVLRKQK